MLDVALNSLPTSLYCPPMESVMSINRDPSSDEPTLYIVYTGQAIQTDDICEVKCHNNRYYD